VVPVSYWLLPSTFPSELPSVRPSSSPSRHPSTFPTVSHTSHPSVDICEEKSLNIICDYELDDGFVEMTYTAICTEHEKGGTIYYHNECVPTDIIDGLSVGDLEPNKKRKIVACGCCPEYNPSVEVKDPKGGAPWCEGGLDCFAGVNDNLCDSLKSGNTAKFYVCVSD
jgi:hypothetical protein